MTLTVGSLFSGIGGLDLGLERAGMRVIWQSEIDPYACRVLNKHWPEVPNLGNIKEVDWADVARPDVICGGYPCQPFSTAGKRQGEEDPRHLWPWVREALRILRPRYAILENVRGHLSLGGSTVIGEIASLGYDCEWRIVSAASVGANHRRDRLIIVAYPQSLGLEKQRLACGNESEESKSSGHGQNVADADGSHSSNGGQRKALQSQDRSGRNDGGGSDRDSRKEPLRGAGKAPGYVADADNAGSRAPKRRVVSRENTASEAIQDGTKGPLNGASGCGANVANTESRDGGNPEPYGLSTVYGQAAKLGEQSGVLRSVASWWETEPDVGRVAHGVPSRVDRLRGLGNAVVPQVAEVIGRLVVAHYETVTA